MKRIRAAKSAHLQWRARAQALVAGLPIDESKLPVIHTDCKFGRWYYGEGQGLGSLDSFRAIEVPHEVLHGVYMKIFKALHQEDDRSALAKLFGKKNKHKEAALEEARGYLSELVDVSGTLLTAIEVLEKDLKGMTDGEVQKL
ncbi:MAG: CZB domain-containing protein [Gammaproteobacteria bacterium]|nr:CZB domain-containing protein [Gammaproteobacteria bacterium]